MFMIVNSSCRERGLWQMCRREVNVIYYPGEKQHIGVGFKVRAIASHLQPRCTH